MKMKFTISLTSNFAEKLSYLFMKQIFLEKWFIPAGNYMFKVNNRNTRTSFEVCSKLAIKKPE